ncbi:MAG: HlyC/CorC family transporter [Magnetococcales bacterium]|nr:HlyC/CorC family transporter [Magnetococcales bacterium]
MPDLAFIQELNLDPEITIRILLQVLLLVLSAFFSGSETALFSISRLDLQKLRTTRHPHSEKIHELLDEPRRLIISILCGNELVNIASSANMAAILLTFFDAADTTWINILIMVPLLLLVGEVTPKTFAVRFPIKFSANLSARFLPRWIVLITPLRAVVRMVADRITTWIVGEAAKSDNILQPDEFRTLVEESEASGVIEAVERVLIDNMLEAGETEIVNIMTPRTRIRFLDADMPLDQLVAKFRKNKHSRVPVIRNYRDNILGFLRAEDLLHIKQKGSNLNDKRIEEIIKPAHFVPPTLKVDELFDYFQVNHTNTAIVLGEYGGVSGIVSMRDVLTFIFGEISGRVSGDEYYQEEDDNSYKIPGDMRLTDFNNLTNFSIEDPIMTTIGGVVLRHLKRLPRVGDTVAFEGIRFTVLGMDLLRIKTLEVAKIGIDMDWSEPSPIVHQEVTNQHKSDGINHALDSAVETDQPIDPGTRADEAGESTTKPDSSAKSNAKPDQPADSAAKVEE